MSKNYKTIKNFNGPYINYKPEIKVYDITEKDEYIVLASDGFWDLINNNEIEHTIKNQKSSESKQKIAKTLFDTCIDKAAREANLSTKKLLSMNPGQFKRDLIDDITIMIVDLKNQTSSSNI